MGPGLGVDVDLDKVEKYAVDTIPFSYRPTDKVTGYIPIKPHY
jgi:hypothetical protein